MTYRKKNKGGKWKVQENTTIQVHKTFIGLRGIINSNMGNQIEQYNF